MKRAPLVMLLLLSLVEAPFGCSERVPLAKMNSLCEYDEQCAQGLACRCIRRRNPDDEGPDEIVAPGICQTREYVCSGDAGPGDVGTVDAAGDGATDADAGSMDAAPSDAADGG